MIASRSRLAEIEWKELQGLTLREKGAYFNRPGGESHVLIAQQFNRERLDALGTLATVIRRIAKSDTGARFLRNLLWTRRAMLYFTQPSSRTFLSFRAACQVLGIASSEIRDTATSSEVKGETQEDSVRTFSSYCDVIVMRTPEAGLAERMAWVLEHAGRPVPIVNAGSGKDQHPTQAVLDIYTLQRSFEERGGIDGKRILFVGDLLRGRTVRSLAWLLTNYADVELVFIAPPALQVGGDILAMLDAKHVRYRVSDEIQSSLAEADAVYMTRVQDEWDEHAGDSQRIDISRYSLGPDQLARLPAHAVILHPFPRRNEIHPDVDQDPRAMYWRQMRNGMWIRAALLVGIFRREAEVLAFGETAEDV